MGRRKGFRITDRDREILSGLYRLRWVSTEQAGNLYFGEIGVRSVQRGLVRLVREGLVVCRDRLNPGRHTKGQVWSLTQRGSEFVAEQDGLAVRRWKNPDRSPQFREHTVFGNELYVRVIGQGDPVKNRDRIQRFDWGWSSQENRLEWKEIEGAGGFKEKKVTRRIYPDVTLEISGRKVFLEMDRSTKALSRVRLNLETYQAYASVHSAPDRQLVYVVISEGRRDNILSLISDLEKRLKGQGGSLEIPMTAYTLDQAADWLRTKIFPSGSPVPEPQNKELGTRNQEPRPSAGDQEPRPSAGPELEALRARVSELQVRVKELEVERRELVLGAKHGFEVRDARIKELEEKEKWYAEQLEQIQNHPAVRQALGGASGSESKPKKSGGRSRAGLLDKLK